MYPTETVYGLGCDPLCAEAVNRINVLKGRDANKGLILLASRLQQLDTLIDVSDRNRRARTNQLGRAGQVDRARMDKRQASDAGDTGDDPPTGDAPV